MSVDPALIRVGMGVVDFDGEPIGTVKEVHPDAVLVDRPLARDVYVPLDAVQAILDATATDSVDPRVVIGVAAERVGKMGWRTPGR